MDRNKPLEMLNNKPNKIQDRIFVQRILAGEREIYGLLVHSHYYTLRGVIRSYLKEENDVEEILQKTLVHAYQLLEHFNQKHTFSHWLINIGIIEAKMRIDQLQTTDPFYSDDDVQDKLVVALKALVRSNGNGESGERFDNVEALLERLPRKCRVIYVLKEIGGMENKEIAQCLQVTTTDVKSAVKVTSFLLHKLLPGHLDDAHVLHHEEKSRGYER